MAKTKQEKNKVNQKHVNKYITNNYDRINLTVPKGDKERIKSAAEKVGIDKVNTFITKVVMEEVARIENK